MRELSPIEKHASKVGKPPFKNLRLKNYSPPVPVILNKVGDTKKCFHLYLLQLYLGISTPKASSGHE